MKTRSYNSFLKKEAKKPVKKLFGVVRDKPKEQETPEESPERQIIPRKNSKQCLKQGRWSMEEHRRFVEAIIKYGNNWKKVQQIVQTRSCSQARSHAQKFFLKLKRSDKPELSEIIGVDCLLGLRNLVSSLKGESYKDILKELNSIAQEKPGSEKKEEVAENNDSLLFDEDA